MTTAETKMILATLRAAYPNFYAGMGKDDLYAIVNLWAAQFEQYDGNVVYAALQALISTKVEGYPPTIGAVKEQIGKLFASDQLNESEAWALVSRACSRGIYESVEEFNKLPPSVQKAVGRPDQLKAWAMMDEETVQSVIASNFKRTYRVIAEREKEMQLLPSAVRNYIENPSMPLLEGKDKKND